jgi:hypothetical protein
LKHSFESPPVAPGGVVTSSVNEYWPDRTIPDSAAGYRDEARSEELNNLRLALATFALQLDAFELRTRQQPFRAGTTAGIPAWPPDAVADFRGKK